MCTRWQSILGTIILTVSAVGCGRTGAAGNAATPSADPAVEEHPHRAGHHGGTIVSIGRNHYHAEIVFAEGGMVRVFLLDQDEARALEVPMQALPAYVMVKGDVQARSITLKPESLPGDSAGHTSQFVGQLPEGSADADLLVSVPRIAISGERLRFAFERRSTQHAEMPSKVVDEDERLLYLTPQGKYTAADIAANGNQTPSQRFRSFKPAHDLHPKSGDRLCPVTQTKANPECWWIIGGRRYEFCCPPCIDEFVKLAREKPAELKPPGAYAKK